MFFFWFRILSMYHIEFTHHISLGSLAFLMTLTFLKNACQMFCRISLNCDFSDFLVIRLELQALRRLQNKVLFCAILITLRSRHPIKMIYHCWYWLSSPSSVCHVSPLQSYSLFPLSILHYLERRHYVQPTL